MSNTLVITAADIDADGYYKEHDLVYKGDVRSEVPLDVGGSLSVGGYLYVGGASSPNGQCAARKPTAAKGRAHE